MTLVLAALLISAALVLAGQSRFADPAASRLSRLVPLPEQGAGIAKRDARGIDILHRVLTAADPSFAESERMLRALGVYSRGWIAAIEAAKLVCAVGAAFAAGVVAASLSAYTVITWFAAAVGFGLVIVGANTVLRTLTAQRQRWLRRELALGIEILCIFLEGGQSLDQAFRSFCDICGKALPRLVGIQRALISELDNGVPYVKAIEHWAENMNTEEAKPLAALFVDSLVHGTELVPHLRQFSQDLTERRIATARASIGVKSSQLTVIMVAFFLPAILAFVTAPAFTALTSALGTSR